MLSFFPRDVLDEILKLIESVSEGFPTYSCCKVTCGAQTTLQSYGMIRPDFQIIKLALAKYGYNSKCDSYQ